jgi:hypothetical protein
MKLNLKINTSDVGSDNGIVYVLQIKLEDKLLVKIGITNRSKVEQRVSEILIGIWKKYRVFPECYVKRFKTTTDIAKKEQFLHEYFHRYRYETLHEFGGHTEFFYCPLEQVVEVYDQLLAGEPISIDQTAIEDMPHRKVINSEDNDKL